MQQTAAIPAERRSPRGKGGARQLRREGRLPAIVYGGGEPPLAVAIDLERARREARRAGFHTRLYDLELDGGAVRVLPHALALHPVTDDPLHIDFLRVTADTRVTVDVPVAFRNEEESPGLKRGGVLNIVRRTVGVTCPAGSIPEELVFDLAGLEIGDSLHISHTELGEGVVPTITDRDFTVASLVAPSALLSQADEEEKAEGEEGAEAEEGAEGEAAEDADAEAEDGKEKPSGDG